MPAGARPIASYSRYYAGAQKDGRPIVHGTFVLDGLLKRPAAPINIVEEQDMPVILDGGCAIVNLQFDVQSKQVLSIFCNGEA